MLSITYFDISSEGLPIEEAMTRFDISSEDLPIEEAMTRKETFFSGLCALIVRYKRGRMASDGYSSKYVLFVNLLFC